MNNSVSVSTGYLPTPPVSRPPLGVWGLEPRKIAEHGGAPLSGAVPTLAWSGTYLHLPLSEFSVLLCEVFHNNSGTCATELLRDALTGAVGGNRELARIVRNRGVVNRSH